MRGLIHFILLSTVVGLFAGCGNGTAARREPERPASDRASKSHGHSHEGDDVLFWQQEGIEYEGYAIKLGHHGIHVHAGHELEPAVSLERNDEPVDGAKVYVRLLDAQGQGDVTNEVSTVYEPPTAEEPAHYAQGKLMVPKDAKKVMIRYRIVLPDNANEFTQDVPVMAEKH